MGLWNTGVRRMEASAAGAFTNVVPVVGLGFAVWLGEAVSPVQLLGGVVAGAGIVLAQRRARPRADEARGCPGAAGSPAAT
jgi:drug/metabolite transporter (DMT)-like permease